MHEFPTKMNFTVAAFLTSSLSTSMVNQSEYEHFNLLKDQIQRGNNINTKNINDSISTSSSKIRGSGDGGGISSSSSSGVGGGFTNSTKSNNWTVYTWPSSSNLSEALIFENDTNWDRLDYYYQNDSNSSLTFGNFSVNATNPTNATDENVWPTTNTVAMVITSVILGLLILTTVIGKNLYIYGLCLEDQFYVKKNVLSQFIPKKYSVRIKRKHKIHFLRRRCTKKFTSLTLIIHGENVIVVANILYAKKRDPGNMDTQRMLRNMGILYGYQGMSIKLYMQK